MAHARATFLTTYLSWVKPSLLAVLLGGLTATFALVVQASNAVPVILKTLNIPACLTYADVYRGTQSDFRKEGVLLARIRARGCCLHVRIQGILAHAGRNPDPQSDAA